MNFYIPPCFLYTFHYLSTFFFSSNNFFSKDLYQSFFSSPVLRCGEIKNGRQSSQAQICPCYRWALEARDCPRSYFCASHNSKDSASRSFAIRPNSWLRYPYCCSCRYTIWQRAALMRAVFDGLTTEKHSEDGIEVGGERLQRKNDKTRQFLARTANQIFTSRELSSVEACANLLGYPNSFSSQKVWQNVHMTDRKSTRLNSSH